MNIDIKLSEELKANYGEIADRARRAAPRPDEITVIAVSKTHPADVLAAAVAAGIKDFGENYVQEMKDKYDALTAAGIKVPRWHFIGHLQTNKVKYIAPFVDLIHSVDSLRLAEEISRQAEKNRRTIDIMLQVNTSGEESKSGCEPNQLAELYESARAVPNINIVGLMTIGSFSPDEQVCRREFSMLAKLREEIATRTGARLEHLSMGMSGDFEIALALGATMVRVGTAIFGNRFYAR